MIMQKVRKQATDNNSPQSPQGFDYSSTFSISNTMVLTNRRLICYPESIEDFMTVDGLGEPDDCLAGFKRFGARIKIEHFWITLDPSYRLI